MTYFYVKSGGTASGGSGQSATPRTGSFAAMGAANYYDSLTAAIADTPAPLTGDIFLCSDQHNFVSASSLTLNAPQQVAYISVDDANCDQYKRGASEGVTSGDYNFGNFSGTILYMRGMEFTSADDFVTTLASPITFFADDCSFTMTGTSALDRWFNNSADAQALVARNCDFVFGGDGQGFKGGNGKKVVLIGGSISGNNEVINRGSTGEGGTTLIMRGVDCTGMIPLVDSVVMVGSTSGDDVLHVDVKGCLFNSDVMNYSFIETSPTAMHGAISVNVSAIVGDNYFYQLALDAMGEVETDTTQYLIGGATYDDSTGFSLQAFSRDRANAIAPFRFLLAVLPAQDLSGGAKTYTVELVSSDSGLTDLDIWLDVMTQDNTDQALSVINTTLPNNILGAGSALTISSAVWASTSNTEYSISVTVPQKANVSNSNVEVWVCLSKPNIIANFDPAVTVT